MKKLTVEDFLECHNNVGGFSRCPVIVQLDNDPPHERMLSLYFFSRLESEPNGAYDYWVRDGARKQNLDLSEMIVVGFHPITIKDTGFFAELGINIGSGFVMLVKAHPIEVFENSAAEGDFSFSLPASQVAPYADVTESEKPKARPFTIAEFNERFKLGSSVHFVKKDGGYERRVLYTGYCIDKLGACVCLGIMSYKLQDLFDHYKLAIGYVKKDDREEPLWGVFGVDSKVYKYEGSLQR